MITSDKVKKVIDNFYKVLPGALREENLNMGKGSTCGSIHCHAGWYLVATQPIRAFFGVSSTAYWKGAMRLFKDLGFNSKEEAWFWLRLNPVIWGNEGGTLMFSSSYAFYHPEKRRRGALTLKDIIDHWTEVYERLKIKEQQESLVRVNITGQLAQVQLVEERLDLKEIKELTV